MLYRETMCARHFHDNLRLDEWFEQVIRLTIKKFSIFIVTSPPAVSKHGSEQRKVKNLNNLLD